MKKFDIKEMIKEELRNSINEAKYYSNPKCPECNKYNAMLPSFSKEFGQSGTTTRECRDCGFEADYSDSEMIDIGNDTETNKRIGDDGQLEEATTDWSKANLSDQELSMVVALYNQYSGERKRTVDDLQSINLDSAGMYFDEYINDMGASPVGKKAAKGILKKLWKINEQMLGEGTNYTSNAINELISKSDVTSGFNPKIKLNSNEFETKWLDLDWKTVSDLADMIENTK